LEAYKTSNDAALAAEIAATNADFTAASTDRALIRTEFAAADSALSASLSAEIDADVAAEAALRVAGDDALDARLDVVEGDMNTVGSIAKAQKDAEDFAQDLVNAENAAMLAAVAGVQADVDQNEADADASFAAASAARVTLQSNIDAEATARANADTALEAELRQGGNAASFGGSMADLDDAIIAEEARALAAEAALDAAYKAADLAIDTAYKAADATLQGNIDVVAAGLAQELLDRAAEDTALDGKISAEESRALAAEAALDAAYKAADVVLQGNLDAYITANNAAVAAEEAARIAADTVHTNAISAEESARIAGDAGLQSQIDSIISNTDPAALDSLTEIVAAFQAEDGNLQTAINSLSTSVNSAISAEEARALAAEAAIQADVDQNEADGDADRALIRTEFAAADSAMESGLRGGFAGSLNDLDVAIIAEETARVAADASATTDRAAIRSEFAAADLALDTAYKAADVALQADIDAVAAGLAQELLDRAADVDAEEARALAAEAAIQADVDANELAASNDRAAIRGEFAAADATLQSNIDAEEAARIAEDNNLHQEIDSLKAGAITVNTMTDGVDAPFMQDVVYHLVTSTQDFQSFVMDGGDVDELRVVKLTAGSTHPVMVKCPVGMTFEDGVSTEMTMFPGGVVRFIISGGLVHLI
jgi:hypothetical protein